MAKGNCCGGGGGRGRGHAGIGGRGLLLLVVHRGTEVEVAPIVRWLLLAGKGYDRNEMCWIRRVSSRTLVWRQRYTVASPNRCPCQPAAHGIVSFCISPAAFLSLLGVGHCCCWGHLAKTRKICEGPFAFHLRRPTSLSNSTSPLEKGKQTATATREN